MSVIKHGILIYREKDCDDIIELRELEVTNTCGWLEVSGFDRAHNTRKTFYYVLESDRYDKEFANKWLVLNKNRYLYEEFEGEILDFSFGFHLE